jgi:hypothetical protein
LMQPGAAPAAGVSYFRASATVAEDFSLSGRLEA